MNFIERFIDWIIGEDTSKRVILPDHVKWTGTGFQVVYNNKKFNKLRKEFIEDIKITGGPQ